MPKYLVKVGLNYPPDRRAEAGDVIEDLPPKSIKWLREQGVIELLDANGKTVAPEPSVEEAPVETTPVVEDAAPAAEEA